MSEALGEMQEIDFIFEAVSLQVQETHRGLLYLQ